MGLLFELDEIELESFSGVATLWLGLVMVPLDCLVVGVEDNDEPERVVSFSSTEQSASER